MKILRAVWFTEMVNTRPIGIVLGIDIMTKKYKAYIGTAGGYDEKIDSYEIAT